ncbi:MAG TPA: F0F1 ATP synthase subunit delta [Casimicrobiaceae bacterium]|jgi:F-type H+-transporting ATPase subunit delta|nr:F0F1 ATP synthase subunit delta [Casimicrobiaceae bacterium]
MAELSTIARPYAEAAFGLARQEGRLAEWSQMLSLCAEVVADPKVAAALDNPLLDVGARESLLLSIAGDRLDAQGRNFVHVLVDAGRVAVLPEIAAQFETLKDDAEATAKALIESALPLTDAELADLTQSLARRFGRRIEATVAVDPSLIGGARVTVGDAVIDGSVQAKLAAMSAQLRA